MTKTTKTCPYCCEEINADAVKCRFCGSRIKLSRTQEEWTRDLPGRWFLGVASALAAKTEISVYFWRVLFVVTTLIHGIGALLYLSLWAIIPFRTGDEALLKKGVEKIQEILGKCGVKTA